MLDAVNRVDMAMCRIRDAGKIKARDRIAVLAALNLAFELPERTPAPPPRRRPHPSPTAMPSTRSSQPCCSGWTPHWASTAACFEAGRAFGRSPCPSPP
jgi:hypothetical protein